MIVFLLKEEKQTSFNKNKKTIRNEKKIVIYAIVPLKSLEFVAWELSVMLTKRFLRRGFEPAT